MSWTSFFIDPLGLAYYPEWSPFNGDVSLEPGANIEAWIADLPGDRVESGCGSDSIPDNADIDFIRVNGRWYKIKALTAYVSKSGHVVGAATYAVSSPHSWTKYVDGGTPEYNDYIDEAGPQDCECSK